MTMAMKERLERGDRQSVDFGIVNSKSGIRGNPYLRADNFPLSSYICFLLPLV